MEEIEKVTKEISNAENAIDVAYFHESDTSGPKEKLKSLEEEKKSLEELALTKAVNSAAEGNDTKVTAINNIIKDKKYKEIEKGVIIIDKETLSEYMNSAAQTENTVSTEGNTIAKLINKAATEALELATEALTFLLTGEGLAFLAVAIAAGVVAFAIKKVNDAQKDEMNTVQAATEAYKDHKEALEETQKTASTYYDALELSKKAVRSSDEEEEYQTLLQNLQETYPQLVEVIDSETLALNENSEAWEKVAQAQRESLAADREKMSNTYANVANNGVIEGTEVAKLVTTMENTASLNETLKDDLKSVLEPWSSDVSGSDVSGAVSSLQSTGFSQSTVSTLLGETLDEEQYAKILDVLGEHGTTKLDDNTFLKEMDLDESQGELLKNFVESVDDATDNSISNFVSALKSEDYQTAIEQSNLAQAAQDAAALLDKTMSNALADAFGTYAQENGISDSEMESVITSFYSKYSEEQISALNNALSNISDYATIDNAGNLDTEAWEEWIISLIPGEVGDDVKAAIKAYIGKLEEQVQEDIDNKTGILVGANIKKSALEGWTQSQLTGATNFYSDMSDYAGVEEAKTALQDYVDIINSQNTETGKLAVSEALNDLVSAESIDNIVSAKESLIELGVAEEEVEEIIVSGNLRAQASFASTSDALETLSSYYDSATTAAEGMANAISGSASYDEITEMINNGYIIADQLEATADGFKVTSNIDWETGLKNKYQEQMTGVADSLAKLQSENDTELWNQAQSHIEAYGSATAEEQQQIIATIATATGASDSDIQTLMNTYSTKLQSMILIQKGFESAVQATGKALWEANQNELEEALDKAQELYEEWTDILSLLQDFDLFFNTESVSNMLDLQEQNFEATLDLNLNPEIDKQALEGQINTVNAQLAAATAKRRNASESKNQYADLISQEETLSIDANGAVQKTAEYEKLVEQAANASNNSAQREALESKIEQIDNLADAYTEVAEAELEAANDEKTYLKQQKEMYKTLQDNVATLERQILDIIQANEDEELENFKTSIEEKKNALQDYLDAVQDSIDKERNMRDLADSEEDIRQKERKLSILQMDTSGMYAGDIASLQNEISDDRRNLEDSYVDNYITNMQDEITKMTESYDNDITAWEEYLEWKKSDYSNYALEVEAISTQSSDNIKNWILQNDTEVATKTSAELESFKLETDETVNTAVASYEVLTEEIGVNLVDSLDEAEENTESVEEATASYEENAEVYYGNVKTSVEGLNDTLYNNDNSHWNIINNIASAWENAKTKFDEYLKAAGNYDPNAEYNGGTETTTLNTDGNSSGTETGVDLWDKYDRKAAASPLKTSDGTIELDKMTKVIGEGNFEGYAAHSTYDGDYIITKSDYIEHKNGEEYVKKDKQYVQITELQYKANKKDLSTFLKKIGVTTAFKTGGYVDYTGPAWVDGTPAKPEAFLNADDTSRMEQLISVLQNGALSGITPTQGQTTSNNTISVEINVDELGDNYDVHQLAEDIQNEIYNNMTKGSVTFV